MPAPLASSPAISRNTLGFPRRRSGRLAEAAAGGALPRRADWRGATSSPPPNRRADLEARPGGSGYVSPAKRQRAFRLGRELQRPS
ncbi:MAG: hypothetical protein CFK52_13845 [Chloracidobacterium sp. CP2_5A]|nr:MAG: hypothetical protein CFK52_13845 [Chloracidobacterium sp. CP2_5A]